MMTLWSKFSIGTLLFSAFWALAPAAGPETFPVEETTIMQLQAAHLAGKTTARAVIRAYS